MPESSRPSKSDTAYATIKARIAQGEFKPGDRLVLEQLARELSVSPMPIREAVRRLEAEGWVVFHHNVGAQVAAIDLTEYGGEMETLALLEGYATAVSAPHIGEATLAEAERLNKEMRHTMLSFEPMRFTRLNHEFHVTLCAPCPNQHLRKELAVQWRRMDQVRRSTFSLVPSRAQSSIEEHATLLGLIRCGAAPAVIETFARQHKLNTLRTLSDTARGAEAG